LIEHGLTSPPTQNTGDSFYLTEGEMMMIWRWWR